MEELSIKISCDKKDRHRFYLYAFFGRSAYYAAVMIFVPLIFLLLPAAVFIAGAVRGRIFTFNLIYLAAAGLYLFSLVKRLRQEDMGGLRRYIFAPEGVYITSEESMSFLDRSNILLCEESRYFFTLMNSNRVSYPIPKRFLTAEEGGRLRELFPERKIIGRLSDKEFEGIRCDDPVFAALEELSSFEVIADDAFIKSGAGYYRIMSLPSVIFLSVLSGTLCMSLSVPLGIAAAVLTAVLSLSSGRRTALMRIKTDVSQNPRFGLHFYTGCFDYDRNGVSRIFYSNVRRVKKYSSMICISTDRGNYLIPYSEELFNELNKFILK